MESGPDRAELYRPFVSTRGRRVALIVGASQLVVLTAVGVTLPPPFTWLEKSQMVLVAILIAVVLWRFARVRAIADATGLVVHNLMRTTSLEWAQIVAVRLGGGAPWVSLDLDDGETLAVMGIQRADGEIAQAEAKRLATLVALNSRTARDS